MKQFLEELKSKKKSLYQNNYHEMLGAYKGEKATTEGYNGRQILELIQNCDDEGSGEVLIKLDKDNNTISISNLGTPFSEKGYRSLNISNLSSKTSKRKYIGNKGLGFRSIINWSDVIRIISNKVCLSFSKEIVQKEFNLLFDESQREEILRDYDFSEDIIPIPFLALPEITNDDSANDYTTTIEIQYKPEFYSDIIAQIKKITPETLLFLHHINEIKFENIEGIDNLKRSKELFESNSLNEFRPSEKITINENVWHIFNCEAEIDTVFKNSDAKELEFYQLKIAIKDDLSDSVNRMFSYFPTNVAIELPFIIHGTFDLDQNRNQLNQTDKNKYVIQKLVELIAKTAKFLSKDRVNWSPLQLLSYKNRNNVTLENLGFYSQIDEVIEKEALFPCIDNTYKKRIEVLYLDDEFSKAIIENQGQKYFPELLLPIEKAVNLKNNKHPINTVINDVVYRIDNLSKEITDIHARANFIKCVNKQFPQYRFNLLIDREGKLIEKKAYVFTPSKLQLSVPEFSEITFIHTDLFNNLLKAFNVSDARGLQRILKQNFNIVSYEPVPLAERIVSSTNQAIRNSPDKETYFIAEMVKALFQNYKQFKDTTILSFMTMDIPLLSKNKTKTRSINLYLSNYYPTGIKTTDIFGEIYDDSDFLARPDWFGIIDEDIELVEQFFLWLGVNKFVKYEKESITETLKIRDYMTYLNHETDIPSWPTSIQITILKINNLEKIVRTVSLEKIICWVSLDKVIKDQLDDSGNQDEINYFYRCDKILNKKPSYLKYALSHLGYDFNDHLLDSTLNWVNKKQINYTHAIFKKYEITPRQIDNILIKLGATDDFDKLSIGRVTDILEQLPKRYPDGRNSLTLYKKALKQRCLTKDIKLFAHDGEMLRLFNQNEIYFSDTIKIPSRLRKKYPIFNFPLRAGANTAIAFYKINNLNTLKIDIESFQENNLLTNDFNLLFDRLKPYLLVHRLDKIEKDTAKKQEASKLDKIKFVLCNMITCKIESELFEIDKYEFIKGKDSIYYLHINEFDTLSTIQRNSAFSESFSEIISNVFDITGDKNEFRLILTDDISYTEESIKKLLGSELLLNAKELFGFTDHTLSFWKPIFTILNKQFGFTENYNRLLNDIKEELNLNLPLEKIHYEKINDDDNIDLIKGIFDSLGIIIEDFNNLSINKLSLENRHKKRLKSYFNNREKAVKASLWNSLKSGGIEKQERFLNLLNNYERHHSFIVEVSEKYKQEFEIDEVVVFNNFIAKEFENLIIQDAEVDLISILKKNEAKFSEDELDDINNSTSLKSLLYFSESLNHIKDTIAPISKDNPILVSQNVLPNSFDYNISVMKNYKTNTIPVIIGQEGSSNGVYTPNQSTPKNLKRIGNTSEGIVYQKMIELYSDKFVIWKSKENEGLHYDFKYSPDKGQTWKYADAKTFSNNTFYLSRHEEEFGKQNKSNYEIWLICPNQEIKIITDLFSNSCYILNPKDYIVHITELMEISNN